MINPAQWGICPTLKPTDRKVNRLFPVVLPDSIPKDTVIRKSADHGIRSHELLIRSGISADL